MLCDVATCEIESLGAAFKLPQRAGERLAYFIKLLEFMASYVTLIVQRSTLMHARMLLRTTADVRKKNPVCHYAVPSPCLRCLHGCLKPLQLTAIAA